MDGRLRLCRDCKGGIVVCGQGEDNVGQPYGACPVRGYCCHTQTVECLAWCEAARLLSGVLPGEEHQTGVDSGNELFPGTQTSDVLTAIALLPQEANAIRKSSHHISRIKKHIESISDKAMGRVERNKRIVNMYLEGFSIDEIFKESGFSSRSSVFRILNEANVQLDRGRWKGPLGPRKKKED